MSRRTTIQDGEGTGKNAIVDPGGYLFVQGGLIFNIMNLNNNRSIGA